MPRPKICRRVGFLPGVRYFKPQGAPLAGLEINVLSLDEAEAVRLADLEGLYQEQAAQRMGVSRQTFGNIVERARRKIADCIVNGKALRIETGAAADAEGTVRYGRCGHEWRVPPGSPPPRECPTCGDEPGGVIHPDAFGPPWRGRGGRHGHRGGCGGE